MYECILVYGICIWYIISRVHCSFLFHVFLVETQKSLPQQFTDLLIETIQNNVAV